MITQTDYDFMNEAIEIAKNNFDNVTNKGVGCIIVNNNRIVGSGCRHTFINFCGKTHKCVHAEHMALLEAGKNAYDATVYVTMEPCLKRWHNSISWHFPTCCSLLIQANVKRVVIGSLDDGFGWGGVTFLQNAGIIVENLNLDLKHLTEHAKIDDKVINEFKNNPNFVR